LYIFFQLIIKYHLAQKSSQRESLAFTSKTSQKESTRKIRAKIHFICKISKKRRSLIAKKISSVQKTAQKQSQSIVDTKQSCGNQTIRKTSRSTE
jgi:hypothetical protein